MSLASLRILQILPSLESGGVEKNTLDLLKFSKLLDNDVEFHVASSGGLLVDEVIGLGIRHHTLPLKKRDPFTLIKNISALKKVIKNNHIDIVHARSRGPAWSALWAARQCGVPFVTTYHGTYNATNCLKRFYNSVMARGDKVIAISKFMHTHILSQHKNCNPIIEEIYEGIYTSLFDPNMHEDCQTKEFRKNFGVDDSKKLLLLVGRLTRWKGQAVLLKAAADLDSDEYVIMFIGDDQGRLTYKKELEDLAKTLNVDVRFIKNFHPLSLAYAAADVVFSCSTDPEAFGRITAEALCMGRPFIGTNCGATVELTKNGDLADLVMPNNQYELRQAIQKVINTEKDQLYKKSLKARDHILSNYNLEKMCKQTLQLYKAFKRS